MARRVVIVEAGGMGRALAARLAREAEVVVVDPDPARGAALGCAPASPGDAVLDGNPGVKFVCGDATSRLVLSGLASGQARPPALVATSERDEVNAEAGRVGRALGYGPILAVTGGAAAGAALEADRVVALDRFALVADHLHRSLRHSGAIVPVGVGLGLGELVEVRLLRTSPVLGRPLRDLSPTRWRVAAVFRGDSLVLPTGDTTLQVDDRVLLVGDPAEMPDVAEHVRMGRPQFPHPFGPNVVTLEVRGPDPALAAEAASLASRCCVERVLRGLPPSPPDSRTPTVDGTEGTFDLPGPRDPRLVQHLARREAGVVLTRPPPGDPWAAFLGRPLWDARLCDGLAAPVIFARGKVPYRRILLPVSDSGMNLAGTELAIDLTRQHGASLSVLSVSLPPFLTGQGEETPHGEVGPIQRLCDLYGVPMEHRHRVGNPVRHILSEASGHDLVLMTRRRGRPDSWMNPDIALRVGRQAPCSVMVLTVERGAEREGPPLRGAGLPRTPDR